MQPFPGLAMALFAVCAISSPPVGAADKPLDAFGANQLLVPGINLGNTLEAPREGDWGLTLKEEYFEAIARARFKGVRIPIRWSAHADTEAPYTIDAKFFERVDWAVEQALSRRLATVINVHHYSEMDTEPEQHLPRLLALWRQIAARYKDRDDRLFFELFNEPHDKLTDELWQTMFPKLLSVVRESNPRRMVIIGPGSWNNVDHLDRLSFPEDDRRLIATFHYYTPFEFTHQGASWVPGSDRWKGRGWSATAPERGQLTRDMQTASQWSIKHQRPIFLGEFGAYSAADMKSRATWTRAVAEEAEKRGFSWCYWEFGAGFGLYDPVKSIWREPLRDALLERK
jgi:endoglucanase